MKFTVQWWRKEITETVFFLLLLFAIRTLIFSLYHVPSGSMETTMFVGERYLGDKLTYFLRAPRRGEIIAMNEPEYEYSKNLAVNWFQRYVWGPSNFTKRVIGVPGDHVKGVIEDGKPVVYLNGEKLNEPYLNKYPLILVYKADPALVRSGKVSGRDALANASFDPNIKSWKDQPFYKIDPLKIVRPYRIKQPGDLFIDIDESGQKRNLDEFDVHLGEDEFWLMGDNRLGSSDCRYWGKPVKGQQIHAKIIFRLWSLDSDSGWPVLEFVKHPIEFFKRIRWSRIFNTMS